MKQGTVLLGALLLVFLLGSARGLAAGPRLVDEGRTLILLDEVREPQEKRQPGITLAGDRVTGGRQVRIAGHGITQLREIAAVCGGRNWQLRLSDFRQTPETNVATYDVPGDVVAQVLNSPECSLLIAGARIAIPRELVSAVWALPGSAPQLPPGKSASSSASTATPAESCAVRTPGGDPSRISPGERVKAVKAIEALGALRDWTTGPQGKDKAEYASRVANTDKLVGEYLAGGQQGGQGELASAIRAAMSCFKEALRVWPNVNQSWLSAVENVRGVERYLNVKSPAERQEEERTRRTEVEAKQQEVKHREATNANSLDRLVTGRVLEKIKHLKASSNDPAGDYFIGSPEEQKHIVRAFVADNSKSDPTYLYIAANTAYRIGQVKEAGFLFYAAQIRKAFDYKRYGLGEADGNNIQTYWGFLNATTGVAVNPAILRKPQEFSEVVDMIGKWQVVPVDDALYPKEYYGSYAVSRDQWPALAAALKQEFMDKFGNKYKKVLSDSKNVEAFNFVQDYNFGKIPHNPENDRKYQEYLKVIKKAIAE